MKICYIADGRSIHTERLATWFAKKGHEMHLITDNVKKIKGVDIHPIRMRGGGVLDFIIRARQTKKIVKIIKPDILHAHFVLGYGFFGAYSGFHPFIVTMWADEIIPKNDPKLENTILKWRFAKITINYTLRRLDLIQTLDTYQKRLCMKFGIPENKIVVLYNYVDTDVFSPDKRSQDIRTKLGINGDVAIICLRGFHSRYKIETFIKAIPLVLKENANAKFILAGEQGTVEDKQLILNLTRKLGIEKNVNFVGHISQKELPAYLASSDIHVDTCVRGAGTGHGNMEAMSCGLPRVASYRKGIEETVKNGETGFVFRPEDSQDLAEKLLILINNEKLRKEFGKKVREFVERVNKSGQNEIGIEKYYEKLVVGH